MQPAELGVAVQNDVDRVRKPSLLPVPDVGEDAPSRGLVDERLIVGVEVDNHRAGDLLDERRDQVERVALMSVDGDDCHIRVIELRRVGEL